MEFEDFFNEKVSHLDGFNINGDNKNNAKFVSINLLQLQQFSQNSKNFGTLL